MLNATARRQEFLEGVGGIDLLAHMFLPRLQGALYAGFAGDVPRKILQNQAKQLAEMFRDHWIAGGEETEGRTPQQFADEQLAGFIASVEGTPFMAFARWAETRKKTDS